MNKIDDTKVKLLIHSIGLKYNLQDEIVRKIVGCPYKFARETIKSLQINEDITEEEYEQLKTNFNFPYIGKLYSNFEIFNKFKKMQDARNKKS